jgi:hypothetical protein
MLEEDDPRVRERIPRGVPGVHAAAVASGKAWFRRSRHRVGRTSCFSTRQLRTTAKVTRQASGMPGRGGICSTDSATRTSAGVDRPHLLAGAYTDSQGLREITRGPGSVPVSFPFAWVINQSLTPLPV